ncbi:protease complex subunit PrcB family protein [Flavobacterium jejuense]|uniref:Protease complex subunit PrcB family protein n=1 Tax=Flavobacterium jejuense TaxID=1544455 RepID=A0ABX0ITM1_9FLAO|nr:protease complex subunit PrcB family protein [Flavobacterium jejuense]NHN26823.1 protease complex subunit PrcB family protein [Flavobacterium jejuense]
MKIIYINIILFFLMISCCSTKKNESSSIKENTKTENQLKKETEFEIVYSSEYGGNDEFSYLVIENSIDLNKEVERLNISNELSEIYNFNFDEKVILFLYLGQKNTGGYAVAIDKLEKVNDEIIIYSRTIAPSKGENVTMALTNPYCIVIIPKAKKYSIK